MALRNTHVHIFLLLILLLPGWLARAQDFEGEVFGRSYTDSLRVGGPDSLLLRGQFIRPGHCHVLTPGGDTLVQGTDYTLESRGGVLKLLPGFYERFDTTGAPKLVIQYKALPFSFAPVYRRRELVSAFDTTSGDTVLVSKPSAPLNLETIFGKDLQKLKPVVNPSLSDSAIFDNVLELLTQGGRSIEHGMIMMIPEAFGTR